MPAGLTIRKWTANELPHDWNKRRQSVDGSVEQDIQSIISEVRSRGDVALIAFTEKYDKVTVDPENLRVTYKEIKTAYANVTRAQIQAIELMQNRVASF